MYDVYGMDVTGRHVANLTRHATAEDGAPSWSPDGQKIAFQSTRDGNVEIYVINVDGSGSTRLTNSEGFESFPAWSPDGQKIAFAYAGAIHVMNPDGSGRVRLTNPPPNQGHSAPAWSPDGRKIAFHSGDGVTWDIYVANADGSDVVRLTNSPHEDLMPRWRP